MFVENKQLEPTIMAPGVSRKVLGRGGSLMMVEVNFEKGRALPKHSHHHEQVSYIVQGSFEFDLDGEKRTVKAGDSVYMAPNVEHGVLALEEDSKVVDVFSPQRDDFLE